VTETQGCIVVFMLGVIATQLYFIGGKIK